MKDINDERYNYIRNIILIFRMPISFSIYSNNNIAKYSILIFVYISIVYLSNILSNVLINIYVGFLLFFIIFIKSIIRINNKKIIKEE